MSDPDESLDIEIADLQSTQRQVIVTLEGPDREILGEVAAAIRELRPPEPYKGKGVKYAEETIKRKAGKSAAGAAR